MNAAAAAAAAEGNDHELETIVYPHVAPVGAGGVGGFVLNDSREMMKDISSMLFGNTSGNNDGEVLNFGVEVYTNDNDDDDNYDDDDGDDDGEFYHYFIGKPTRAQAS